MPIKNPQQANNKKVFGLIGKSLEHSFSKKYFTDKFEKSNLNHCAYQNFELEHIDEVLELINSNPDLYGLNVTIPYKSSVIPFLSLIDKSAENIGAVNTIKIERHKKGFHLIGYNTDWIGFIQAYKEKINQYNSIIILGTGGASKAVQYALHSLKKVPIIVSRSAQFNTISYTELGAGICNNSLFINTTPLGMFPDTQSVPSIPLDFINDRNYLIDLVYNPEETSLMQLFQERDARTENGYNMLTAQAEVSWNIWQSN